MFIGHSTHLFLSCPLICTTSNLQEGWKSMAIRWTSKQSSDGCVCGLGVPLNPKETRQRNLVEVLILPDAAQALWDQKLSFQAFAPTLRPHYNHVIYDLQIPLSAVVLAFWIAISEVQFGHFWGLSCIHLCQKRALVWQPATKPIKLLFLVPGSVLGLEPCWQRCGRASLRHVHVWWNGGTEIV